MYSCVIISDDTCSRDNTKIKLPLVYRPRAKSLSLISSSCNSSLRVHTIYCVYLSRQTLPLSIYMRAREYRSGIDDARIDDLAIKRTRERGSFDLYAMYIHIVCIMWARGLRQFPWYIADVHVTHYSIWLTVMHIIIAMALILFLSY